MPRAAAEEQARIARELHDIIGHSVSVMTIQAAAGGDAFDSRPAQVREALRAIESTGRETLTELRRLLGVRAADDRRFAPAPGSGLDALVERVRAAGLAVELRRGAEPAAAERRPVRLPDRAGGAHEHAQARRASRPPVTSARTGALEIEVVDDGRGATPAAHRAGHGSSACASAPRCSAAS